ncbi:MAG: ABC transporter substrate-binding protein, partial [Firmicutes bacterium]|nr:ABC transporter substrate-binding protein [Bacillota bacterium]
MKLRGMIGAITVLLLCMTPVLAQEEPVKIGIVANLTGAAAMTGNYIKTGVDMAIEEINAAGGIRGRRVVYIAE